MHDFRFLGVKQLVDFGDRLVGVLLHLFTAERGRRPG